MTKEKNNTRYVDKNNFGKINFIGKSKFFSVLSLLLVIISLIFLQYHGLNYGIDFAGGTEIQVKFDKNVKIEELRDFAKKNNLKNATVQKFGEGQEFLLRFQVDQNLSEKEMSQKVSVLIKEVTTEIKNTFKDKQPEIRRIDSVGPQIGEELKRKGLLAVFYSLLIILVYVGLRFDYKFSPGAVLCLFHDAIITLGIFVLLNKEVNIQTLAAILTIIGYSLNDTIVNYDRIRENVLIYRDKKMDFIINRSINDVLSRTILTSITTLVAIGSLYFIAGGVIEDFAFTLIIGILIGTYSSIYIASPMLLFMEKMKKIFAV